MFYQDERRTLFEGFPETGPGLGRLKVIDKQGKQMKMVERKQKVDILAKATLHIAPVGHHLYRLYSQRSWPKHCLALVRSQEKCRYVIKYEEQ